MGYEDEMDAIAAEFKSVELVGGATADKGAHPQIFRLAKHGVCRTQTSSLSEGASSLAGGAPSFTEGASSLAEAVDENRRRLSQIDPMSRTPIRVNK